MIRGSRLAAACSVVLGVILAGFGCAEGEDSPRAQAHADGSEQALTIPPTAPPTTRPTTQPAASETAQYDPPKARSAHERATDRTHMVESQIAHPRDGRDRVTSSKVLEAMRAVPRHSFVPENRADAAYVDSPLPIGYGQTISQPYIVALMTELLEITPDAKVLEIGTGSGYQAAVLAHLTPHVYTIEIVEPLAVRARNALADQGYSNVAARSADGYFGWPEKGPFDCIIVTCAAGHLPPPLWEQLKAGGRIVIPIGGPKELQRLVVMTRTEDGKRQSRTVTAVRFVPLTRGADQ